MARKKSFAFRPMPTQAQGIPQRPATPPAFDDGIDRSLGPDSTSFTPPAPALPRPVMGRANGLGQDHDEVNGWHSPATPDLDRARGLENAIAKITANHPDSPALDNLRANLAKKKGKI